MLLLNTVKTHPLQLFIMRLQDVSSFLSSLLSLALPCSTSYIAHSFLSISPVCSSFWNQWFQNFISSHFLTPEGPFSFWAHFLSLHLSCSLSFSQLSGVCWALGDGSSSRHHTAGPDSSGPCLYLFSQESCSEALVALPLLHWNTGAVPNPSEPPSKTATSNTLQQASKLQCFTRCLILAHI